MSDTVNRLDLSPNALIRKSMEEAQREHEIDLFFTEHAHAHTDLAQLIALTALRFGTLAKRETNSRFGRRRSWTSDTPWLSITHPATAKSLGVSDPRVCFKISARFNDVYDPNSPRTTLIDGKEVHGIPDKWLPAEARIKHIEDISVSNGIAERSDVQYGDVLFLVSNDGFITDDIWTHVPPTRRLSTYGGFRKFMGVYIPEKDGDITMRAKYLDSSSDEFSRFESLAHVLLQESMILAAATDTENGQN
jgi:hypothetical protein